MTRTAFFVSSVLGASLFLITSQARASSGVISGTLQFYNKNGHYCPTGASCTQSLYKQAAYGTFTGFPEIEVILVNAANFQIASGSTDSAGNYKMSWAYGGGTGNVTGARLRVNFKQKHGRFVFHSLGGSHTTPMSSPSEPFTLVHGSTQLAPQVLATYKWGNAVTPHTTPNLYWAAWKMWESLKSSPRMVSYFTGLCILVGEKSSGIPVTSTDCQASSCAHGRFSKYNVGNLPSWAEKKPTIVIDGWPTTAFNPQSRVMHEMGHIADFLAGPSNGLLRSTGYNYDALTPNTWDEYSLEWRPTALTEGLATFLAVQAFHTEYDPGPYVCTANGNSGEAGKRHCYPPGTVVDTDSIEDRLFGGSCVTKEGRRPISAMRYFWDIYDFSSDGTDATDLTTRDILESLAVWPCASYPACYLGGNLHDQFTSISSDFSSYTINNTQRDEGNGWRYTLNMLNNYTGNPDVQGAYYQNCLGSFN